ncbi:hypothetical protein C0Q70_17935 [Pomacea canaliculata]|uniref:SRCR domain-containing protein n=1 Tax=Pomacea canaliculata TaxID=400727 RepID=A0A2T7NLU4_POMCA|nr:hypothetical protein C0Q70_17935 [Pomacea canaliculata]
MSILLDEVDCQGDETNIFQCGFAPIGTTDCGHSEDVGVLCQGPTTSVTPASGNMTARLVGGNATEGRLEVNFNNQWGTVCDDYFSDVDAQVVCAMLGITGFSKTSPPFTNIAVIPTITQIRLVGGDDHQGRVEIQHNGFWGTLCDDSWGIKEARVTCNQLGLTNSKMTANDSSVVFNFVTQQCRSCANGKRLLRPRKWSDLAGRAPTSPAPFVVRLSGGASMYEGRVEVRYNNYWGTVCDDNFEPVDAQIVCRTLGYRSAGKQPSCYIFVLIFANYYEGGWEGRRAGEMDLPVRLANGGGPDSGRVEVEYNGRWGTVCDTNFDNNVAAVICRQLGYSTATAQAFGGSHFGAAPDEYIAWVSGIQCVGAEPWIGQCNISMNTGACDNTHTAGVACNGGSVPMSPIRLVGGLTTHEGRVEIFYNNTWGTVCDDFFGTEEATVVCRTLGFQTQGAVAFPRGRYGAGTGTIWLDDVSCAGSEQYLDMCAYRPWGHSNCAHREDVSVSCGGVPTSAMIRLVGSSNNSAGRVEMKVNGTWGTVCSDLWNTMDAMVVCGMLGFSRTGSQAVVSSQFGHGSGPIWLDDVQCTGYEESLLNCRSKPLGQTNCDHTQDAGVICSGSSNNYPIRLNGSSLNYQGRVEIMYNGQWGTICDDNWDDHAAQVVCQQLGFVGVLAIPITSAFFSNGTGNPSIPILLDDVRCSGSEASISDCNHRTWGTSNCQHAEDAGVMCLPQNTCIIRLTGVNRYTGRVEIQAYGIWGTVCDDSFDSRAAQVVCRMLGYQGGTVIPASTIGDGTGPIWLDDIRCLGTESSLMNCTRKNLGVNDCQHDEDVGVSCTRKIPRTNFSSLQIRLVGNNQWQGRLEVFYNNTWGTVCDDHFDSKAARVVCTQLGLSTWRPISLVTAAFGQGTGPIWRDDVVCSGTESSLVSCRHASIGTNDCRHSEDVGIICPPPDVGSTMRARLVGPSPNEGRLEVSYNMQPWGTVCDDSFNNVEAAVVCRMLGFSTQFAVARPTSIYGSGSSNMSILLDDVHCTGNETNIFFCAHRALGDSDCQHREDVGVMCGGGSSTADFIIFLPRGRCCRPCSHGRECFGLPFIIFYILPHYLHPCTGAATTGVESQLLC